MRNLKRFLCLAVAAMFTFCMMGVCVPMQASAETVPMTWKEMDKAYITLIVDDNNAELQRMYDLITGEYGFPLCAAVPVKSYDKTLNSAARPYSLELLHEIQDSGGEILSHLLTHKVFNRDVPWATVDYELGESYRRLSAEGFRVNGVILAGGGGTEDTDEEYRGMLEEYTSKYYKYSDCYGVSTQYYHPRKAFYDNASRLIGYIDNAIKTKSWDVIYGHGIDMEIFPQNEEKVRRILDYLKEKQDEGVLEVVTYREVHKEFGDWATPVDLDTIPTPTTTTTTTTTTTATTTSTVNSTTSSKTRPVHTTPTFLTSTTAAGDVNEDVPESQAPDASTDTPTDTDADRPTGEKDPAPWIPWVIGGAAVALCTAGAITAALIWRKKRTPPTE